MHADEIAHRLVAVAVPSGTCMATLVEPGNATPRTGHGILIVPALGIEHSGSDRLIRLFADHAARLGHVVLNIEPVGTGDSTELPDDIDLVSSYRQAIAAGVRSLATIVGHITVVGTRFGALAIAASFADDTGTRELVCGAVLIEPVTKGRNYRRELLMLGASTSAGLIEGWAAPAGSVLRPSDLAAIQVLNLDDMPPPARRVLIVHAGATPLSAGAATTWAKTSDIETLQVPFEQVVIEDPELGRPLAELITAITTWIPEVPEAKRKSVAPIGTLPTFEASEGTWTEHGVALTMTDGEVLLGVRTTPMSPTLVGLVLLSTGTNPRFGPARLHAVVARRLAKQGVATLRIERRGAGVDGRSVDAYNPIHISDAQEIDAAACTVLQTSNVVIAGMCSGAWAAWHATLNGLLANRVVLMNQIIFGEDSWDLSENSPAMAVKTRQSLGDPQRWRAILRGEIRMVRSARNLARYAALTARHRLGGLTGLRADLETIACVGTGVHFVFDDAESGLVYLHMHGSDRLTELMAEGRVTIDVVHGAGHVFSSPQSVDWLCEVLAEKLGQKVGAAPVLSARRRQL